MPRRILVTGAAGFISSRTALRLLLRGARGARSPGRVPGVRRSVAAVGPRLCVPDREHLGCVEGPSAVSLWGLRRELYPRGGRNHMITKDSNGSVVKTPAL